MYTTLGIELPNLAPSIARLPGGGSPAVQQAIDRAALTPPVVAEAGGLSLGKVLLYGGIALVGLFVVRKVLF